MSEGVGCTFGIIDHNVHHNVHCDCCGATRMFGVRYKCSVCPNYDLCEACEPHPLRHRHDPQHVFFKISRPGMIWQAAPPALRVRALAPTHGWNDY